MTFPRAGAAPSINAAVETTEKQVYFGGDHQQIIQNRHLKSTALDAGNTPTTMLRPGLILGQITATGLWVEYNVDAVDGTETARAVLLDGVNMLSSEGTAEARHPRVLLGGNLVASQLLLLDDAARRTLGSAFNFDDDEVNRAGYLGAAKATTNLITDATIVAAQSGTLFVCTTADCTATLPTIAAGLIYEFVMCANFELVVASAAGDDMIIGNDLSADSITFTTTGEQIGARIRVEAIYVGTTLKWLTALPQPAFGTGLTGGFTVGVAT